MIKTMTMMKVSIMLLMMTMSMMMTGPGSMWPALAGSYCDAVE